MKNPLKKPMVLKQYADRFSRPPAKNRHGEIVVVKPRDLTDAQKAALVALSRHRWLDSYHLAALTGSKPAYMRQVLRTLKGEGNFYVRIHPEQERNRKLHVKVRLKYGLDNAGVKALRAYGLDTDYSCPSSSSYPHDFMCNEIIADFEIGAKATSNVRLAYFRELNQSKMFPQDTLKLPSPHVLETSFMYDGKPLRKSVIADAYPFAIFETVAEQTFRHFVLLEVDRDSETREPGQYTHNSIRGKLAAHIAIFEQSLYQKQWGFPNLYVLWVCNSETGKQSIMRTLEDMTAHNSALRKNFLFARHPDPVSDYDTPKINGRMLIEEHSRVGYPAYCFLKPKKAAA